VSAGASASAVTDPKGEEIPAEELHQVLSHSMVLLRRG